MKFTPQETESIANICKDLGVANLYLFGSALDASRFNDQSDLDFLVEFNDTQIDGRLARFTGLASALEQLLNRQVDLVSYQAIRNPFFRQEVDSTKTRIFTLDAAQAKKLIWDVLEISKAALRYLSGLDFEAFCSDDKTQAAVERRLEIAGEALKRLREIDEASLSEQIPDYFRIIGLRNHIAHGYDNVDLATLWDAAANHTPQLIAATQSWLENADMVP